eukprot:5152138-Amphidinium_carterae.1
MFGYTVDSFGNETAAAIVALKVAHCIDGPREATEPIRQPKTLCHVAGRCSCRPMVQTADEWCSMRLRHAACGFRQSMGNCSPKSESHDWRSTLVTFEQQK